MLATRPTLFTALALGLLAAASSCGSDTLDPGSTGAGGTGGGQCGPVCDIYCAYGNVLDANGCPTCSCKPDPGCPTIDLNCGRIYCPYGFATDTRGCASCQCAAAPICAKKGAFLRTAIRELALGGRVELAATRGEKLAEEQPAAFDAAVSTSW